MEKKEFAKEMIRLSGNLLEYTSLIANMGEECHLAYDGEGDSLDKFLANNTKKLGEAVKALHDFWLALFKFKNKPEALEKLQYNAKSAEGIIEDVCADSENAILFSDEELYDMVQLGGFVKLFRDMCSYLGDNLE